MLVEPRDLGLGIRVLAVKLAKLDVAAHGHVVVDVLGDEIDPIAPAPLVQQLRLHVQELLDLSLEQQSLQLLLQRRVVERTDGH
jgi:hypothetical protein